MPLLRHTSLRGLLALVLASAALAACDDTTEPSTPSTIVPVGTPAIAGRAGETANVTVRVTTSNARALAGQTVTFTVATGGGAVAPATATTNEAGEATAVWTFGRTVGAQTLTATVAQLAPVTFVATVGAGRPASLAATAGDNQTTSVGATVAQRPAVIVRDAGNNPVPGVTVVFTPTQGGGTVTGGTVQTDAAGIAAVGSWQLGTTAGVNRLQALVLDANVTNNPVIFTATGTAAAPARLSVIQGGSTSGVVGSALATANLPAVLVTDGNGNPVSGVPVTFRVTSGGGTIATPVATTNAQGIATLAGFTLGTTVGINTIGAVAQGVAGETSFVVTGLAGAAAQSSIQGGNNQSVRAGSPLPLAPTVRVADRFGNPVQGATVTFSVRSGGGAVSGATQTTNAAGVASVGGFILGTTPGANTLAASVAGLPDLLFTATGLAGAPATITRVSGDSVTVQAFQTSQPIVVLVRDSAGFPVRNATVNFAIATGGVGVLSATSATTDSLGRASVTYRGTGALGATTVTASIPGVGSLDFFAQTVGNTPATVQLVAGQGQSATAGTQVGVAPRVRVLDAAGNPVPGVTVFFSLVTGGQLGGGVQNTETTTDTLGFADAGGWILGGTPGENVLSAVVSAPNVANNPIRFIAQGVALPPNLTIAVSAGDQQTAARGNLVATQPAVIVRSNGNPVAGVTVQFNASGDGQVSPIFVQTDAQGIARTSWRLTTTAGGNQLNASIFGAGVSVNFTATAQ